MNTVKVIFKNPKYNYRTSVNSKSTEKELRKYFVGGMFDVGKYPKENLQEVIDINLEKPTDTKDHLLLRGYTAYDMARSKIQAEEIAEGVKGAYRQVEIMKTTTEANKNEFPYMIYVNEESIKRNMERDFGKESLEVFNRGNESEQKKRNTKKVLVRQYILNNVETIEIWEGEIIDNLWEKYGGRFFYKEVPIKSLKGKKYHEKISKSGTTKKRGESKPKGKRKPNGYFQALGQARRSNAKSFKYKGKTYVRKEVKAKTSDTILVYYKKVDFSGAFGGFFN